MSDTKQDFKDLTLPSERLSGIYRGVIENNDDPLQAGRCQIRVFGIHSINKVSAAVDGVPTAHLPWAEPCNPIFGGISKVGIFGVPCQGAHVFLFFENGNILQPRYFATAPGIPKEPPDGTTGFYDPDEEFPTMEHLGEPDWNEGKGNPTTVYPNSFVLADKAGNKIEFDSTPGEEKIIIEHGTTHSKITIDKNGGIVKESGDNSDETRTGNRNVVVGGNDNLTVTGSYNITAQEVSEIVRGDDNTLVFGNKSETVIGIKNEKSAGYSLNNEGNADINISGDTDIKSGNSVKIESLLFNINLVARTGSVSSNSLLLDLISTLTATLKGDLETTVGGGTITNITSQAATIIGGAVIMIGG